MVVCSDEDIADVILWHFVVVDKRHVWVDTAVDIEIMLLLMLFLWNFLLLYKIAIYTRYLMLFIERKVSVVNRD